MCEVNGYEHSENLKSLMRPSKKEFVFKIVVIGDFGVGKTSIIKRYADGTYSNRYKITIGVDFAIKTLEWDDRTKIILQIWDVAGHERFGSLTSVYYRYAVGAVIVFDLTRPHTFHSIEKWLTDLRNKVSIPENQKLPIILLANKGDITTSTLPMEIVEFCNHNDILAWYITSAKEDTNIDEAMFLLVQKVLQNNIDKGENFDESISLNQVPEKKYHKCCRS